MAKTIIFSEILRFQKRQQNRYQVGITGPFPDTVNRGIDIGNPVRRQSLL